MPRKRETDTDLMVYTENRCFCAPGSTKYTDNQSNNPPLPKKEIFMATRMKTDLGINALRQRPRVFLLQPHSWGDASPRPGSRARGRRKRGSLDMAPSQKPVPLCKPKYSGHAPRSRNSISGSTPGMHPHPYTNTSTLPRTTNKILGPLSIHPKEPTETPARAAQRRTPKQHAHPKSRPRPGPPKA